jgi:Flagellar hook capping protein
MQDIDFTGQLAQLQALEEQMAMTKSMTAMRVDTQLQAGSNMIGKYVSGIDKNGDAAAGLVTRVLQKDGDVYLELSNKQQVAVNSVSDLWNDSSSMAGDISNAGNIIGMWVNAGYDSAAQPIQGIVEKVIVSNGEVQLKLYGGKTVGWNQVKEIRVPTEAEALYALPDSVREQYESALTMVNKIVTGTTDDGKEVTSLVGNVGHDGTNVYLTLYNGEKVKLSTVTEEAREPTATELAEAFSGKYVKGLDGGSDSHEGVVVGAKQREDGLVVVLSNGQELYWDALTEIRNATNSEKEAAKEEWDNLQGANPGETGGAGKEPGGGSGGETTP